MIILNLSYIIKKKLHCLNYKYVQILIALYVRFYEEMIVACNIKIEKLKKERKMKEVTVEKSIPCSNLENRIYMKKHRVISDSTTSYAPDPSKYHYTEQFDSLAFHVFSEFHFCTRCLIMILCFASPVFLCFSRY